MMFRSLILLSLASAAAGGFAEDTCLKDDWVPLDNSDSPTGKVRCCATAHGKDGEDYAKCDTSSCINNFNAKNRNCFNYGAPQNGKGGTKGPNQGSAICPYADSDHAICDTSFYDAINPVACRTNPAGNNYQVHCLGKVKCNTVGVTVPKNGHSDGTAPYDNTGETECLGAMEGFAAGDDCFYDGASENWKVCEGPEEGEVLVEEPEPAPPAPDSPSAEDINSKQAFTRGDPHFKTFGGELYDYHGECDLVLLHNPDFKGGLGMDIHIRTKIEAFWSSVESAAIKIGDDTLEIKADPESKGWLWLNGEEIASGIKDGEWTRARLSGLLVRFKSNGVNTREANIYLKGSKEVLVLKTFKSFARIDINWQGSSNYDNSVGLLGSHAHQGKRLGRDGQFIEDVNEFGQEWQVRPDIDGELFHSYEDAVVGKKCVMPPTYHAGDNLTVEALRGRRLGASALDEAAAEQACNHLVDQEEKKACVFDVIATQDLNMASTW